MRPPYGILSGLALLALAPAVALASNGADDGNSGPGKQIDAVTQTTAGTPAAAVKPGVATAPGQQKVRPVKDDGTSSDDATAATPDAEPAVLEPGGAPVVGERAAVEPQGAVRVRLPGGAWTDLPAGASVPNGTMVDTRAGSITLTTAVDAAGATQSATFNGATFTVDVSKPVVDLALRGGDFARCPKATSSLVAPWAAFAAKARKPVRRLFGSGHGRFRTQGRNASATVRGTIWVTEDFCDRTVVTVRRGVVAVRDLHTGRSVDVRAGSSRTVRRP